MKKLFTILSLSALAVSSSNAVTIWNVGSADNNVAFTAAIPGPGGGAENTRFVQEGGGETALPGNSASPDGDGQSDDDYYLAGVYNTQVDGGAVYATTGPVLANENNAERAFLHNSAAGSGGDRNLRYHFNFPGTVTSTDLISVTFGITGMENIANAAGWDVEVTLNGVNLLTQGIGNLDQNGDWTSATTTLAAINSAAGAGPDNYVQIRGTSRNFANPGGATPDPTGSRWLSIDYVQVDVVPVPEPSALGFLALAAAGIALSRRRRS
jgi:hypothetical protein